uniref:Uncharacterized protein n=1 Tax=Arundo donax TaxID=35708 RepID=A0A0A9G5G8_ARUDO
MLSDKTKVSAYISLYLCTSLMRQSNPRVLNLVKLPSSCKKVTEVV